MITNIAKVGPRYQVVIPKKVREAAKLKIGDFLEARLDPAEHTVVLKPKLLVDRDPEVEKGIAAAETALKDGRVLGPFASVTQVRRALKAHKAAAEKKRKGKPRARAATSQHAHTAR